MLRLLKRKNKNIVLDEEAMKVVAFIHAYAMLKDISIFISKAEKTDRGFDVFCDKPDRLIGLKGKEIKLISAGISRFLDRGVVINIEQNENKVSEC